MDLGFLNSLSMSRRLDSKLLSFHCVHLSVLSLSLSSSFTNSEKMCSLNLTILTSFLYFKEEVKETFDLLKNSFPSLVSQIVLRWELG